MGENLENSSVAMEEAKNAAINAVAQRLTETAQMFAQGGHPEHPETQTGELVDSLTWEHTGDGAATVYTDLDYSYWVEFGHAPSGWYANMSDATDVPEYPFFRPAITQVIDGGEAEEIIMSYLNSAVEDADGGEGDDEGGSINTPALSDIDEEVDL